jgi:hypothetical protein
MTRLELVSLLGALVLPLTVLELVRRRRLQERYSLLWLLTGLVIVLLAAWPDALDLLARMTGIATPVNALFATAGAFIVVVLLHFSTVISRLSQENTRLAQHVGLLSERLRRVEDRHTGTEVPETHALSPGAAERPPAAERVTTAVGSRRHD